MGPIIARLFCIFFILSGLCAVSIFFIVFLSSVFVVSEISATYNQNLRYKPITINIDTSNVTQTLNGSSLFISENAFAQTILINTGQSVQTAIEIGNAANATGGPFGNNTYIYMSFTYFWSRNDSNAITGTTIDGQGFSLEVRALFRNKKYITITEALKHEDGLAEFVFPFNFCSTPNQPFAELSRYIQNITTVANSVPVPLGTHFRAVDYTASQPTYQYYSYSGSFVDTVLGQKYKCSTVIVIKRNSQNSCITQDQFNQAFIPLKDTFGKPLNNTLTHDSSPIQVFLYLK